MLSSRAMSAEPSTDGASVIVFDGVCNLCGRWVRFLLPRDRKGLFRFAAMQTEAGRRLLAAHGLDPQDPVSFLFLDRGRAYTDSGAILRVLIRLGWPWRAAAVGYIAPRPLRDALYRWVARNRYRWFGRQEACFVPSPDTRARFLG